MFPGSSGKMIKMNFNVGPSHVGEDVCNDIREAMDQGVLSISHRSPRFSEYYAKAKAEIFKYFSLPDDWRMFCLGTGSEAMEAACRGLIRQRSLHFVNGNFSERAHIFAGMVGKEATKNLRPDGEGFLGEPDRAPAGTDCAFFTKTETATGVSTSWDYIRAFKETNPDVTIVCDVVSVVPTEPLDHSLCDYYFFGVQKGCGLTAGLGISLVSPQALEKTKSMKAAGLDVGANRGLLTMDEYAIKNQTLDTPQILHIYLLGKAFERFNRKGISRIEKETTAKAAQLYDWLERSKLYCAGVKEPSSRSKTAIAVGFQNGVTEEPVLATTAEAGFETGLGYGHLRGSMIRIANFPIHTLADHKELIDCLESVNVS